MELKPLAWYKLRDVFEKITGKELHVSKGETTSIYWDSEERYITIKCPMSGAYDYARYEHELAHVTFGTNPSYLRNLAVRIAKELDLVPWTSVYDYVSALECVRVQSLWAELYSGSHTLFAKTIKKEVTPLDVTLGLAFKPDVVPTELQNLKPIVDRVKRKSIWSLYDVAKSYLSMLKLRRDQEQKTSQSQGQSKQQNISQTQQQNTPQQQNASQTQQNVSQSQQQDVSQRQDSTSQTQQQSTPQTQQQDNTSQDQRQDTSQTQQQQNDTSQQQKQNIVQEWKRKDATTLLPNQEEDVKQRHTFEGDSAYDEEKYVELEDIDDKDSEDMAIQQLEKVKEKVRELTERERNDKKLMFPVNENILLRSTVATDDPELTRELTRLFSKFKGNNYYVPSEQGTAIDVEGYIQRLSGTNAEQWIDVKNRSRLTVVVVLDLSDSMEDVLELLASIGLSLRKALEGVKAIRFKVYGYYGRYDQVHVKELTENEMKHISCAGTTPTAEALEYIDTQLEDTSDRKLMIIVTDGRPTDIRGQSSVKTIELTRYRVNMLRQHGVQVFTIVLLSQQRQMETWVKRAFGPEGAYTVANSNTVGKIVVGMVASHVIRALTY